MARRAADERNPNARDMYNFLLKLGFSEDVAAAMVDDQGLDRKRKLLEYDDDLIEGTCKAVRKPSSGQDRHQIPEIVAHRLQLVVYYAKHMERTRRELNIRTTELSQILALRDQRLMEKNWTKHNPEHKPEATVLDAQRAATAFDHAVTILRRLRGVMGVPLSYVVRNKLYPYEDDVDDDVPCGHAGSKYQTFDEEMEARAPILTLDPEEDTEFKPERLDEYEKTGPFYPAYLADTKKVWSILHALWGNSGVWTHVKSFDKAQNRRQVYRTLMRHFFGGNKVSTIMTGIHTTLRGLTYSGDTKHFSFDKYVTNHVNQHNLADRLTDYGAAKLDEHIKIDYFMTGIKSSEFDATKNSVTANRDNFTDFDAVKNLFVEFRRLQHASRPAAATSHTVASVGRGGGRGGAGRGGGGRGSNPGRGGKNASFEDRKKGLPPQPEIDACTHIVNKKYPDEVYNNFTKAEKAKIWQLRHPGQAPGTDAAPKSNKRNVSAIRSKTDDDDDNASLFGDDDDADEPKKGSNRDNSALKRKKSDK